VFERPQAQTLARYWREEDRTHTTHNKGRPDLVLGLTSMLTLEYCQFCHRLMATKVLRCPGCGKVRSTPVRLTWPGVLFVVALVLLGGLLLWFTR